MILIVMLATPIVEVFAALVAIPLDAEPAESVKSFVPSLRGLNVTQPLLSQLLTGRSDAMKRLAYRLRAWPLLALRYAYAKTPTRVHSSCHSTRCAKGMADWPVSS